MIVLYGILWWRSVQVYALSYEIIIICAFLGVLRCSAHLHCRNAANIARNRNRNEENEEKKQLFDEPTQSQPIAPIVAQVHTVIHVSCDDVKRQIEFSEFRLGP